MFRHSKAFLLASATVLLMPSLANAVTVITNSIVADQTFTGVTLIQPDETIEFRFTVLEDLFIDTFSVSATGNNSEADLEMIRFGFALPPDSAFSTILSTGTAAAGLGFLDGGTLLMGSVFSVFFTDGITNDVGLTLSFRTDEVAPIPLPSTGLMMLPFLLAGGFAAWRRRLNARLTAA